MAKDTARILFKSDITGHEVQTFQEFPRSSSIYVNNLKADGFTIASCSLFSLDEMQATIDEAIKQGWKRS